MKHISLAGSIVALVTPFKDGKVDEKALKELVKFHVAAGTNGIVPCGTTGESATLSFEEHGRVIDVVVQAAAGRTLVIAGTGSNNTVEAIRLTELAAKAGANGALLISPYYNKPSQEGLYLHYLAISNAVDLPLVLYSIRSRTGVNIEPETVAQLAKLENIIGIKEASGDLVQMQEILRLVEPSFQLVSGDDALTLPVLSIGGVGVISVLANIAPLFTKGLVSTYMAGRHAEARTLQRGMLELIRALFIETNPVPVKTAMGMFGLINPEVRLPLCRMSDAHTKILAGVLQSSGVHSGTWRS
jgi:4-hydroxy-tetrahydrodipicolinate synthase